MVEGQLFKHKRRKKLVRGVGINDLNIPTDTLVDGVRKRCNYYQTWWLMLYRCYSDDSLRGHPTYQDKTVCDDWLYFSNFRSWMEKQDWFGKQLDKDILVPGNTVYSSETCCFVSRDVNMFMIDRESSERCLPQGVRENGYGKYCAQVKWRGKTLYLGSYLTVDEASTAYMDKKKELAIELAESEVDIRVKCAILKKFVNNGDYNGGGHWTEVVERALNK